MSTQFVQPKLVPFNPARLLMLILALVLGLIVPLFLRSLPQPTPVPDPVSELDFGKLPLAFVPNAGQTDPAVRFHARDMGATISLLSNEIVLSLPATGQQAASRLRLRFDGANPAPDITGAGNLPGVVNYIIGNDPAEWHTSLPTFEAVVYHELYPGIDLRYDGRHGSLKGTYTLAPGANPDQIRWRYPDAAGLRLDQTSGNIVIALASGSTELIETAPYAWQDINGQRLVVNSGYILHPDGSVGFTLGSYDPAYPLVIDPTIVYSTYLGGSRLDEAADIALDTQGNVYVTGTTDSSDFPGNPIRPKSGGEDVFVAKINPTGTAFVYTTYLGGSRDGPDSDDAGDEVESSYSIAVDGNGNAYITGSTDAIDFPTTAGVLQPTKRGILYSDDAFVTKLASNGTLSYSTYLGGNLIDEGEGIAVDSAGQAYIVGSTASSDFPTTPNAAQASPSSQLSDAFVAKLNPNATALVYSTYLGGNNLDFGDDIALDSEGNAYVVGSTASSNFPTVNPFQTNNQGVTDVFIAKLNASGSSLLYSTYLGGGQNDTGYGIALDSSGNAYITGSTFSNNFPTANPLQARPGDCLPPASSCSDAFVAKLNSSGNALVYSTYLGGNSSDDGFDIAVNNTGEAHITGSTTSSNFPIQGALQGYAGGTDAFVTRLNPDGSSAIYSTYLGGSNPEVGNGIEVDNAGNAYVTGSVLSGNFPITSGSAQQNYAGNGDAFVVKLNHGGVSEPPDPDPDPSPSPDPDPDPDPSPSPDPDPDPSPSPDPDPSPSPEPVAPPAPMLLGSYVIPSQLLLRSDETLTYYIVLHNNSTVAATIDVTNDLPGEFNIVAGSITGEGSYIPDTRMLSWQDVQVNAGSSVTLSYSVTPAVSIGFPTPIFNSVTMSAGDIQFTRQSVILLMPGDFPDFLPDFAPPVVQSVRIGEQDALTDPSTQLSITASDDTGISSMYIREWYLDTTAAVARWQVVRSSGWVTYEETYNWTLGSQSGTHFVGVWVRDTYDRISWLGPNAIDSVSLLQPDTSVPRNRAILYAVSYDANESVQATVNTQTGDADLYVWYPGNFLLPNQFSVNNALVTDQVTFTTPRSGIYLFMVYGFEASTFNVSITSGRSVQRSIPSPTSNDASATKTRSSSNDWSAPSPEQLLAQTGLNPLGSGTAITPESANNSIYLPLVIR